MSTYSAGSAAQRAPRSSGQQVSGVALIAIAAVGTLLSARSSVAQAPTSSPSAWELRITSGALVPTGNQRNSLDDAKVTAAQLSWVVRPTLAVTGTFAWARSRDVAMAATPKLDVFSSDLGLELRPGQLGRGAVTFTPFVGGGAGVRSYNYRKLNEDAMHNVAGYAAIGGELGIKRVGVRLEARDYATGFKPLIGAGSSVARNDVVLMIGLRFKRQQTSQD